MYKTVWIKQIYLLTYGVTLDRCIGLSD